MYVYGVWVCGCVCMLVCSLCNSLLCYVYFEDVFLQIYVQDLLRQDGEEVVDMITRQGGEVYVCGDVTISTGVWETLIELLMKYGPLSREDATSLMRSIKVIIIKKFVHVRGNRSFF